MNTTQETSVTSSQDRCCTSVQESKKGIKINGDTKAETEGSKSTVEELFPWIIDFKNKCRSLLAQPNIVALIKLMKFYARQVSINVNECYTKPYRAAKLKDSISETLLFFLFFFRDLVEVCDKNSYLDKMSDLLAMYLDMELKASRRGKEHHSKISARLTSCLYVYLENSSEHILDTFIKAKFINRNYHDILEPVLTKISKSISARPNCDTMYVRYLLIYRLWKKVNNDAAAKNQINATAILHLGPPPPNPTPFLAKYVLPKVPKSQANSTKFLLLHKFDIEKSCRLFIQYCKENREDEDHGDLDRPNSVANTSGQDTSLETLGGSGICRGTNHVENLVDNVNILSDGERRQRSPVKAAQKNLTKHETGEIISALKPLRPSKPVQRLKTKKNGDILFIDLTEDEITEKVIKKKRQLKLHWLTEIKKKLNTKSIKTLDKKKKAETISHHLSNDLTLVDSTSTLSLSTATTPEPSTCLVNDFQMVKSLSTATTPEPDNCVTSNFTDNELPRLSFDKVSEFVEKQTNDDVSTTVTESIPVFQTKEFEDIQSSDKNLNPTTTFIHAVNQSPPNSSISVTELSNALNHISELYDSDKDDEKSLNKINEIELVKDENIPVEHEEVLENIEVDEDSEKAQRTSSESSDVAVIFTRRASDVEIVDLDEYTEIHEPEKIQDDIKTESIINNDVKNITSQTDQLKLTSSSDSEKLENEESIKAVNQKPETRGSNTRLRNSQNLEKSKPEDYSIQKRCDYKSSRDGSSDGVELSPPNDLKIAKNHPARIKIVEKEASIVRKEYIEDQTLIPKINEIIISNKNDLLTNQEPPQFNDNIDGLSLLASVSQHVSHLEEFTDKSLSKPKIINGQVPCSDFEHKNVGELKTELLKLTKSQIIDNIEGVKRSIKDNNLDKDYIRIKNCPNNSSDVVPLLLETTVDLNSSKLHNNLISVENVTQMIKESTNVIVNGETVVLFQKSPNSNLYIINKAVDGTMECLSEDKKNSKRNSTTMRDIINHIPINQEGTTVKNHRNKSKNDSIKKADNNLTKQFKPICEEFSQFDKKIHNEYVKREINTDCYEDNFTQRCTSTPGSVVELERVKKSPPPVIRITDTPNDVKLYRAESSSVLNMTTTKTTTTAGRFNGTKIEDEGIYKKSIKKEFNNRGDYQQVADKQNYLNAGNFYPINSIENVYKTVTTSDNLLYDMERERCSFPSCNNTKVGSSQSYQNISQNCQSTHCDFVKCSYELNNCGVQQYVQQQQQRSQIATAYNSSYRETESYYYSDDKSLAKRRDVDERDLNINEVVLAKLHDDQLLHNIEKSILNDNKESEERNVDKITVREIKLKPEFENKLPLKKRLKAHAMLSMNYDQTVASNNPNNNSLTIKIEKVVENYPAIPMMSIAALESGNVSETSSNVYNDELTTPSSALELLSPRLNEDSLSPSNNQSSTEMIRRDYLKDTSLTSIGNCANVDDRVRKLEHQRRQTISHVNIMATGCERNFKTPAQRKEAITSSPSSLKRAATSVANYPKSPKKGKKTKVTGNNRQTRSSKRNIPKVDYSYDGVIDSDLKFNSLSELRRKRKKTSR